MSYPFGGRSSFRDRTMGKSEDEIFDDMLKNIKQRKKQFFESPPRWRSTGMFDDEVGAGGSRLKAHLDELATRHPELAGHLSDWLPEASNSGTVPKRRTKAETSKNTPNKYFTEEENPSSSHTTTVGTQTSSVEAGGGGGLESDVKLRSTVPDMQSSASDVTDGDRGQRSQSAPPQSSVPNKSQQKEEPERIIPIQTDTPANYPGVHQMPRQASQPFSNQPPHFPPSQQTFQQSSQFPEEEIPSSSSGKKPNVRHIPIFVEGRDEPILPKDASQTSKRGGCQGKPDPHKRPPEQNHHEQFPHHQQQFHPQQQHPQKHQPPPQKQHPPKQEQQQQQQPPQPPPQKTDPLTVVAEIVKEVDALRAKVNDWNGTSRTDKEYIYLDEMLTRNLLKLDNIETEGREEVRNARKEAIRRIQDAINVLELKTENKNKSREEQVPESGGNADEEKIEGEGASQSQQSQPTQESSTSSATQT